MNIQLHPITLGTANSSRDDDQRIPRHKVADAPLLLLVLSARMRLDVKLEGAGDAHQQQQAEEAPHDGIVKSHSFVAVVPL